MPVSKCSNDKWRIGRGDCKFSSKDKAENSFRHWVKTKEGENTPNFNPEDEVRMDIPLLIRVLEYIKEEVKDDVEIHEIAERLVSLSSMGTTLTMSDYDQIVPTQDPEVERIKTLARAGRY